METASRGAMSFLIGVLLGSEPSFFCKLCREEGRRHSSDGTQLEEDAELSLTLTLIRLFNALQDVPVSLGPWRDLLSEHDVPAVSDVGPGVTIGVVHGSRGCLIADIRGVMPTGKDKQPVHRTHPPLDLVW